MKKWILMIGIISFTNVTLMAQAVYMHEAQEASTDSSPIDVILGFLIIILIVGIASGIRACGKPRKRDNYSYKNKAEYKEESVDQYEDIWDEDLDFVDEPNVEDELEENERVPVAFNSMDLSPIYNKTNTITEEQFRQEILDIEKKESAKFQVSQEEVIKELDKQDYVDLGLSVKWASKNLGAADYFDLGLRIRWASLDSIKNFELKDLGKYSKIPYPKELNNYNENISGNALYDVAFKRSKGKERIPTKKEFEELLEKCYWKYVDMDKNKGFIVTGPSGKSIYLPLRFSSFVNCMYQTRLTVMDSYHSGDPVKESNYPIDENEQCSYSLNIINKNNDDKEFEKRIIETFKNQFYLIRPVQ